MSRIGKNPIELPAKVEVTVAGKVMTVAEAIELKSSVGLKERLLANMRHQLLSEQNPFSLCAL
jgi:ribosomal protein L6P/L9E